MEGNPLPGRSSKVGAGRGRKRPGPRIRWASTLSVFEPRSSNHRARMPGFPPSGSGDHLAVLEPYWTHRRQPLIPFSSRPKRPRTGRARSYGTASTAAPICAVRFRHSTKSAARHLAAFKCGTIRLQRHLPREPPMVGFRPQNSGAVSKCSARPDRVVTIARLPRFYNKFCLQSDRSSTKAQRAADRKLARL